MKSRPTILLSGVSLEFASFRDAVENEIEMKGCFAENQPGFPPDYRTVEEMLRRKLADSDAVVHIVGFRFGERPVGRPSKEPRRSYTQMEFDIARELGKPIFIFISANESVRDKPRTKLPTEDDTALQLEHRKAVQSTNHLYYFFNNKAELRQLVAEIPMIAMATFKVDISSSIMSRASSNLIGREREMDLLNDAWMKVRQAKSPRPHLVTFVGFGGEGKTSLVANWLADVANQDWPGCDAVYAWSFYDLGLQDQSPNSSDLFLTVSLRFFGDSETAASAIGAFEKGKRLAHLVGEKRAIVILDGIEPLQYAPSSSTAGELREKGLSAFLTGLSAFNHGLCVLTTRYTISSLKAFFGKTVLEIQLPRLSNNAGVALLKSLGVKGHSYSHGVSGTSVVQADDRCRRDDFEELVEDVKGHALTLNLIGTYLRDAHAGDIRRRDLVKLDEADSEEQGGRAFRAMDAYVRWMESGGRNAEETTQGRRSLAILKLLGLFDRPASADCLESLWTGDPIAGLTDILVGLTETQINIAIRRLENARLLMANRNSDGRLLSLDTHPLVRQYFLQHIVNNDCKIDGQENSLRLAHSKICDHLLERTPEHENPSLEELQPVYQAVMHGCLAGMHDTVAIDAYRQRILKGNRFYSTKKLGAYGNDLAALHCFFAEPWHEVVPTLSEVEKTWILTESGLCLRALGRLGEAVEPLKMAIQLSQSMSLWEEAAMQSCILAQLQLLRGSLNDALQLSIDAVQYADVAESVKHHKEFRPRNATVYRTTSIEIGYKSQSGYLRVLTRARLADTLHQLGRLDESTEAFRKAEELQTEECILQILGSIPGSRYCDLLLADIEEGCWRVFLGTPYFNNDQDLLRLHEVERRASITLEFAEKANVDMLSRACDQLTLGRCLLYRAILSANQGNTLIRSEKSLEEAVRTIAQALNQIVDSGVQYHISRAALPLAWAQVLIGGTTGVSSAIHLLNEAMEISCRGSMPLQTVDVLLTRARLFWRSNPKVNSVIGSEFQAYPWQSAINDLAVARELAAEHRYARREREMSVADCLYRRVDSLGGG